MEKVKVIFNDGSSFEGDLNGNCIIVDSKPIFPTDLSTVKVEHADKTTDVFKNAKVVEAFSLDGRYWFAFVERSEIEMHFAEIEDALCDLSRE